MTIESSGSTVTYAGNDLTSTFAFPFSYQSGADFVVTVTVTATAVTTTLVYGTDYTVNPATNSPATNGSILAAVPVASGSTITITRVTPLTQETAWQANDAYPANFQRIENGLDKLTLALQEQVDGGTITDAGLGSGDATFSTFLRGQGATPNDQRVWTNTLVGSLGALTDAPPTDTDSVFIAEQNGATAIKVISGIGAQGAFRYASDGDANAWAAQWVYDPNTALLGFNAYGGSIKGTFDPATGDVTFAGDLDVTGTTSSTFTGHADASLIDSGTIATARLGSGAASSSTFLRGDQTWAIVAGGGGGINTTTTGTFVIAAVASTQTVPVTSATGIVVGTDLQISDGTHMVIGLVTAIASLNLTVSTQSIPLGVAGNTMASGAAVQSGNAPGNNTIQISDAKYSPTAVTNIALSGTTDDYDPLDTGVFLAIAPNPFGGTANLFGYFSNLILPTQLGLRDGPNRQSIAVFPGGAGAAATLRPAATEGLVLNSHISGGNTLLQFSTIDASASITAATITPAKLNVTNSLTDTQLFGYDSGTGHFKMFAQSAPFTGTAAQFMNGVGTPTSALSALAGAANIVMAATTPIADSVRGIQFKAPTNNNSSGSINTVQWLTSDWVASGILPWMTMTAPFVVANSTYAVSAIDGVHGATESAVGMNFRTVRSTRGDMGFWDKIRVISNPTGTQTINPATGAYVRFESIASSFTIALADTSDAPTTTVGYATEITLEFQPKVSAYTITWPGTIHWLDGATAPQPSQVAGEYSIIKLIRSQEAGDLFGALWFGYRLSVTTSGGTYTDAQARTAVLNSTYLPSSSSITATVVAGTSATYSIANSSVTNAMLAGGIQYSQLQNSGAHAGDSSYYLNNAGTWSQPPGTGGGGGGGNVFLANTQTFTGSNTFLTSSSSSSVNKFTRTFGSASNSTAQVYLCPYYDQAGGMTQDANGIDIQIVDNFNNVFPSDSGVGALSIQHTVNAGGTGKTSTRHDMTLNSSLTGGFSIGHSQITASKRLNGGYADAVWLNSWGPDANYSATPDSNGVTHQFTSGALRIGECNYGNAWDDFGFKADRGSAQPWVAGLEFFPDWLVYNGTSADANFAKRHASWALAIGGAAQNPAVSGTYPDARNWIGLLVSQNGIVGATDHAHMIGGAVTGNTNGGGGYALQLHGNSASGNPIGKAINILDYVDVGIDLSAATFTNTGTSKGQQAIAMADLQSIRLGTIWLRGNTGTLEYSTNGTAWVAITLP